VKRTLIVLAACGVPPHVTPAPGAPCFPMQRVLEGDDPRFQPFDASMGGSATGNGTLGACSVREGIVRDARGTEIAEITCGVDAKVPGVVDDFGLGVGAQGREVLAAASASTLHCEPGYTPTPSARCYVPDATGAWDGAKWEYYVDGTISGDALDGDAALAFFAPRTIVQLEYRGDCH